MRNNEISYDRQTELFNPEKDDKFPIRIIGAGSIGSFATLNLAKLGFQNIDVWDFDTVEAGNIPNQFYRVKDIGKPKVDALKEIIKEFTNIDIATHNEKITEKTTLIPEINSIVIFALDSLETRRLVYEKIKLLPIKIVDARMGGEGFSIRVINLMKEKERAKYEKSLEGEGSPLPCGLRSVIYTNLAIASEITNILKRIAKNESYPKILLREMPTYEIIHKIEKPRRIISEVI